MDFWAKLDLSEAHGNWDWNIKPTVSRAVQAEAVIVCCMNIKAVKANLQRKEKAVERSKEEQHPVSLGTCCPSSCPKHLPSAWYSDWCLDPLSVTEWSLNGHLSCLKFSAITNSAWKEHLGNKHILSTCPFVILDKFLAVDSYQKSHTKLYSPIVWEHAVVFYLNFCSSNIA